MTGARPTPPTTWGQTPTVEQPPSTPLHPPPPTSPLRSPGEPQPPQPSNREIIPHPQDTMKL